MRKNSLITPPIKQARLWCFIVFHFLIFAGLALSVFIAGKPEIDTDLAGILPESQKKFRLAENALNEKSGRAAVILCEGGSFESAKKAAAALYSMINSANAGTPAGAHGKSKNPYFDSVSLYIDSNAFDAVQDYLFKYRYMLLDDNTEALLKKNEEGEIAEDALAQVFGAFSGTELPNLTADPFLLAGRELNSYLGYLLRSSNGFSLKEGVLCADYEGKSYVLIQALLSQSGSEITNKKSAVEFLYNAVKKINGTGTPAADKANFIFSGVPFHSYESSKNAQWEISLISSISVLLIILLFLFVFRSALPVISSFLTVALSIVSAVCSVLLVFRTMHILTFVFGTMLIGTCVDYSIHYFVNGSGDKRKLFRSLSLCLVSTEIMFVILFFSGFDLLKQVSVFLITGILSAYLSVTGGFPYTIKSGAIPRVITMPLRFPRFVSRPLFLKIFFPVFLAVCCVVIIVKKDNIKIDNDLSSFYKMSAERFYAEKLRAEIMREKQAPLYYIVDGSTDDELLQNEERLAALLDNEVSNGNLGYYLGETLFAQSKEKQDRHYSEAAKLIPFVKSQFAALGIEPENIQKYYDEYAAQYHNAKGRYAVKETLPPTIKNILGNLELGSINNKYYSVVMLFNPKDKKIFSSLADGLNNVTLIDKSHDISRALDSLTRAMALFFSAAFVFSLCIILIFYGLKNMLKTLLVFTCVFAFFLCFAALLNIHINLFVITACVLLFGFGFDYLVFMLTPKNDKNGEPASDADAFVSVTLSFITTEVSFGSLAFSTFPPVHTFGLTILLLLFIVYASAMMLSDKFKPTGNPQVLSE